MVTVFTSLSSLLYIIHNEIWQLGVDHNNVFHWRIAKNCDKFDQYGVSGGAVVGWVYAN